MEIYNKHEAEIKKGNGTPLWDYAMTMGYMDESFLIVPVANGKTIVSCIQVPRSGEQIKFVYDNQVEHVKFFQGYTTSEKRKPLEQTDSSTSTVAKPILCAVTSVSMWYPESSSPGGGYWETQYITTCTHNPGGSGCNGYYDSQGNCMPSGYEPPVYPYPGGGGGNQPQQPNQDIISQLQGYPCAQSLVQELPNLKNELAASMKQIFQNNKDYNITFKAKSGLGDTDGITFSSHTNLNTFNAVIHLNDQVLLYSTKEFILVTMYHEVVHAFLDYERFRLGDIAFEDQYPGVIVGYDYAADGTPINRYTYVEGHQQLIPFLTTLQNIISAYNPNLPQDVVVAMARTGITTRTPEQVQLNNNEKNTLLGKQKGTKCP